MKAKTLNEKALYEAAEVELIRFNTLDVIVTSPVSGENGNPPDDEDLDDWI